MQPNKTFAINLETRRIQGTVSDGVEAAKQASYFMLSVPRLEHLIYTSNYGHELNSLIGKDEEYVRGDIQRIIREALMIDERIIGVENFELRKEGETMHLSFRVKTIYGSFDESVEVRMGGI